MTAGNERSDEAFLQAALAGTRFARSRWIPETGSTNDDLAKIANHGGAEQVLITDLQTAGRGRRNRDWDAPSGSGILMSLLIRNVDPAEGFWAVGAIALAASQAIDEITQSDCRLKWPNDVLLQTSGGQKKVAGVLAQIVDDAVIVGIGINVNWPEEVPAELDKVGTSVNRNCGGGTFVDRAPLAADIVRRAICHLEADREVLRRDWKRQCATLGQRVRLELHSSEIVGVATDIDPDGALQIKEEGVTSTHHVGDVVHLRPAT